VELNLLIGRISVELSGFLVGVKGGRDVVLVLVKVVLSLVVEVVGGVTVVSN